MAVVTKKLLCERLKLDIKDPASLRVTPLPCSEEFDEDAIDLKLGSYFFIPRSHKATHFCPGYTFSESLYIEEYVPLGEYVVLPAHHTILGATLEFIKLPWDMAGQILTKSSWARTFITIETAPWVHPRYRGCLTLEIANVSNAPLVLYPGVKIAQLVLILTTDSKEFYQIDNSLGQNDSNHDMSHLNTVCGKYIGPTRPEPSALKAPDDTLKKLGIDNTDILYPYDEYKSHILNNPRYKKEFEDIIRNDIKD